MNTLTSTHRLLAATITASLLATLACAMPGQPPTPTSTLVSQSTPIRAAITPTTAATVPEGSGPNPGNGAILSPDGKWTASVEPVYRIALGDSTGTFRTLVEAHWIAGLDWLPDSKHIVYSDKSDDGTGSPMGIQFDLYIVDIETGATIKLNDPPEDLHNPVVSPTGEFIALAIGTDYGDGCGVDRAVAFMHIDPVTYARTDLSNLRDFTAIPRPDLEIYTDYSGPGLALPGAWQDPTTFVAAVRFVLCEGDRSGEGLYAADVAAKSVIKLADLPAPQ